MPPFLGPSLGPWQKAEFSVLRRVASGPSRATTTDRESWTECEWTENAFFRLVDAYRILHEMVGKTGKGLTARQFNTLRFFVKLWCCDSVVGEVREAVLPPAVWPLPLEPSSEPVARLAARFRPETKNEQSWDVQARMTLVFLF